jgi:autotransporter-associated beta strand protein
MKHTTLLFAVPLIALMPASGGAAIFIKANNTTALDTDGSYTTSGVPGALDTIQVDSTVSSSINVPMGAPLSVAGISYAASASTGDRMRINSTGNHLLTIGAGGIDMSLSASNTRLRIDAPIALAANQVWNLANGVLLKINPTSITNAGGNATVTGAGTVDFSQGGSGTLGSQVTFNNSVVQINLAGTVPTFNNANNSYGRLNLYAGRGVFQDIANKNSNSSAGTGATDSILGGNGTSGVFEYAGTTVSTDRGFQMDNRSNAGSGIDVTHAATTMTVTGNLTSSFGTAATNDVRWYFGGAGNLTLNGVISDKSDPTGKTGITKQGLGTLTLGGNNTFEGGVIVSANGGTLLVRNTVGSGTGSGDVSVESGAALGGNGTISGSVTLAAGAKFVFSASDTLKVNGASLSFGGFSLADLVGLDATTDLGTYTLVDGTATISPVNLSNLGSANAQTLAPGKQAYFSLDSGDWQVVVAVPEPATVGLLLGVGVLALVIGRRRRLAVG